eukprot:322572_1
MSGGDGRSPVAKPKAKGKLTAKEGRPNPKQAVTRESGWDSGTTAPQKKQPYNALYDSNLRHHFDSPSVRGHLHQSGLIDKTGRILEVDQNSGKLHIIEQELLKADVDEAKKQRDNETERYKLDQRKKQAVQALTQAEKINKDRAWYKPQATAAAPRKSLEPVDWTSGALPPGALAQSSSSSSSSSASTDASGS